VLALAFEAPAFEAPAFEASAFEASAFERLVLGPPASISLDRFAGLWYASISGMFGLGRRGSN
jgi:hypothetical protein